jgi:hypothetical protein
MLTEARFLQGLRDMEARLLPALEARLLPALEYRIIPALEARLAVRIDARFSTIDARFSTIDARFSTIDSRMSTLEGKVTSLDTRFTAYVRNESLAQEGRATQTILNSLQSEFPHTEIKRFPLRNFFIPSSEDIYTDFDGCLTVRSYLPIPIHIKNSTGTSREIKGLDRAYIIEAKHGLTKKLVDEKLVQFCKILETVRAIHAKTITRQSTHFANMVSSYDMDTFPDDIHLIFTSDYIADEVVEYIEMIGSGALDEHAYNAVLYKNFKEHDLYKDILDDMSVSGFVKHELKTAKTVDDILRLCEHAATPPVNRKSVVLETHKTTLLPYVARIRALFVPYAKVRACHGFLLGRLGVMLYDELRMFSPKTAVPMRPRAAPRK